MTYEFEAIFEHGAIRPIAPVDLREGAHVRVSITLREPCGLEAATPAPEADWPDWLRLHGPIPDDDAQHMKEAIEEAFEQIDPNVWR